MVILDCINHFFTFSQARKAQKIVIVGMELLFQMTASCSYYYEILVPVAADWITVSPIWENSLMKDADFTL